MRLLVRRHIERAVHSEWPAMARQDASLAAIPVPLVQALDLALTVKPQTEGQSVAQREIVTALQKALDARRQRIIVSDSRINAVKWLALLGLAVVMLFGIAFVHSGNPDDRGGRDGAVRRGYRCDRRDARLRRTSRSPVSSAWIPTCWSRCSRRYSGREHLLEC